MNHGAKWAILIGVNRYHESFGPLKYAVNDCCRVGEVLTRMPDGFPADKVLLITDDQPEDRRPTYANIHSWLASWLSQPKEDDTVLVYFSGHGREEGGKCYLVPADATLQTIHVTGIPVPHVQDLLFRCKAKQKILVLDACHSGAGKDVMVMSGRMMDQIAAGKGIYTITSCDTDELSHEWDEKKQGVFSYYLAEALSGACPPDAQGRITAESLYEWVYDRVRSWAAKKRCTQTPKRFAEGTGPVLLSTAVCAAVRSTPLPSGGQGAWQVETPSPAESQQPREDGPLTYQQWLTKRYKGDAEAFITVWGMVVPVICLVPCFMLFADDKPGWGALLLMACLGVGVLGVLVRRHQNLSQYAIEQAEKALGSSDLEGAWAFIVSSPVSSSEAGRFARVAARIASEAEKAGLRRLSEQARAYRLPKKHWILQP